MGDGATHLDELPFPLTEVDRWVLAQTDDKFKKHDWADLEHVIGEALGPAASIDRSPFPTRSDQQPVHPQAQAV